MAVEYHDLVDVQEVNDISEFLFERAQDIGQAVVRARDYILVGLYQRSTNEGPQWEIIVVDVECDRVPPSNPPGIGYCERLALFVPRDPKQLVEVLALRKDFPVMIHQNQAELGAPASLCLYFESVASVLRTWTAQKFLRRIQWWLEASARGELHTSDQPVEHLFFSSKYELVLPWNFDKFPQGGNQRLRFTKTDERKDGGITFFVNPDIPHEKEIRVSCFEFTLPPVVHGFIERDPSDLGALVAYLENRGVDLKEKLTAEMQARVTDAGVSPKDDVPFTIVLLHIPVVRQVGAPVERTNHRAFIMLNGSLVLGEKLGALFNLNGRYFNAIGLMGPTENNEWRTLPVLAMDVLRTNSAEAARVQSGIQHPGPSGVLIGAGTVGSALMNLWGRSGWGDWTIVDNDYIKPHNLSRHTVLSGAIGYPKATVVCWMHEQVTGGYTKATEVIADALKTSDEEITKLLAVAELVVDATASLEYPRLVSSVESVGRHVSVFLTPNGNSSVLLAEDSKRQVRLRALESQYYRALIQNSWGAEHLDGLNNFRSGASCRDISMVMPYSKVMTHVGTLAEHVQYVTTAQQALIRVWSRDPKTGAVSFNEVQVMPEKKLDFGNLVLFYDAGLEQRLRELRETELPKETGGILLGYFDLTLKTICVVDCLAAPPNSKATAYGFERGTEGLAEIIAEVSRRTAGVVGYIGEWHSHPRGHSASASGDDLIQLVHLAQNMANDGLPAVQLIVGEKDIQVLQCKMA